MSTEYFRIVIILFLNQIIFVLSKVNNEWILLWIRVNYYKYYYHEFIDTEFSYTRLYDVVYMWIWGDLDTICFTFSEFEPATLRKLDDGALHL